MQFFLKKFLSLILIFIVQFTIAQIKFYSTISPKKIDINEFCRYRLIVENAKEVNTITPPDFNNFILIAAPTEESSFQTVNGKTTSYIAYNYMLKPKQTGTFTINEGIVKADGKEFKSNSITIVIDNTSTVKNNSSNKLGASNFSGNEELIKIPFNDYILKNEESVTEKVNKNMFVKLELSKTTCFVGEPIIATYKLYTRLKSESSVSKNPSFNGFSIIDLQQGDDLNYTRENYNGKEYNVYIIRKSQLYPLLPGNINIEPVAIDNIITFIKEEYIKKQKSLTNNIFNDFLETNIPADGLIQKKITIESNASSILVKALPKINAPFNFNGAFGNFKIIANVEKDSINIEEVGKLKITIIGEGNLQQINMPEINWPSSFEIFNTLQTDDIVKTTIPISGSKTITYPFVAKTEGNYILPPINFSFFNPKYGRYISDSTKSINIKVTKGKVKNSNQLLNSKKEKFNKIDNYKFIILSIIAALIFVSILIFIRTNKLKVKKNTAEINLNTIKKLDNTNFVNDKNHLQNAYSLLNGERNIFLKELNFNLKNYLANCFNIPIQTINKKDISENLNNNGIDNYIILQLLKIMDEIERELYTPYVKNNIENEDKMKKLFYSTNEIIMELDKNIINKNKSF